jgi:glutathione S-transferase
VICTPDKLLDLLDELLAEARWVIEEVLSLADA